MLERANFFYEFKHKIRKKTRKIFFIGVENILVGNFKASNASSSL